MLMFDVREWEATLSRKTLEPVFDKVAETPLGRLTFRSTTRLEPETRRLIVSEQHTLRNEGAETISTYDFSMRCWTLEELRGHLAAEGFGAIEYYGAYDREVLESASDRLVCIAAKGQV
jgi:hypothetical protein